MFAPPRSTVLTATAALALGLLALSAPAQAAEEAPPQADDWTITNRVTPEDGFTVTTSGTVEGTPAQIQRSFDVEAGQLELSYTLGSPQAPERSVEAHVRPVGVYVFEDSNGDRRFDLSDEVVDHVRAEPSAGTYVTPVRTSGPLEAARGVVPLDDAGRIVLTVNAAPSLAVVEGDRLAPTETHLNVTAVGLSVPEDAYAAVAVEVDAPLLTDAEDGLVRLAGSGAGVDYRWLGSLAGRAGGPSEATVLEDRLAGEDVAAGTILMAGSGPTPASHGVELGVVHTSSGLAEVVDRVQGEPAAFLVGLVGSAGLVSAAAWRKVR